MNQNIYHYKAIIKKVKDADTFSVEIDCGFNTFIKNDIRLSRINAFEIKLSSKTTQEMKNQGIKGKEYVISLLEGKEVIVRTTIEKEKYGRILAEVYYLNEGKWINLNDELVSLGYAAYF